MLITGQNSSVTVSSCLSWANDSFLLSEDDDEESSDPLWLAGRWAGGYLGHHALACVSELDRSRFYLAPLPRTSSHLQPPLPHQSGQV